MLQSGWLLKPIDGGRSTRVNFTVQTDLGGLPSFVVKMVAVSQPMQIAEIRKLLEGENRNFPDQPFLESHYAAMGALANPP